MAHRRFADAFNTNDLEALVALYEPDAILVPQPGTIVQGHTAIRESLEGFLVLGRTITMDTTYAPEAGELELLRGSWTLTGTGADGSPLTMAGKSTEVVRRQPDGRWLKVIDHPYGAD